MVKLYLASLSPWYCSYAISVASLFISSSICNLEAFYCSFSIRASTYPTIDVGRLLEPCLSIRHCTFWEFWLISSSKDLIKELIISCCWLSSSSCQLIWVILTTTRQLMKFVQPYSIALYSYQFIQNKVLCLNCHSTKCTTFRHKHLQFKIYTKLCWLMN